MRQTRRQFPTEQAFLDELRRAGFLGIDDYRRWMIEKQGRELLKNRYEAKLRDEGTLAPLNPTEREVRAYYDSHRDQIPVRPPTIWIKQIVVRPKPDSVEKAAAYRRADSLAKAIRAGADFGALARRYSADAGSAELGGDLGWNRPGKFVREFDRVAFSLAPGTVSNPVETVYGYHIIQVERVRPTEIKVRHILIAPTIDSSGVAGADSLAHRIRDQVLAGASFDSLQAVYSDPAEEREARGVVIDSLPSYYQQAIVGVDSGQVSGVFALTVPGAPTPPKYGIVKVLQRVPAGPYPFDEIRENIRSVLGQSMGQQKYLAELRKKNYIDIRDL
jgi:peptidyl-prolyl cis-trans isomerase SurA